MFKFVVFLFNSQNGLTIEQTKFHLYDLFILFSFLLFIVQLCSFINIVESYNGSVLRLSRLERKQMGSYLCIGMEFICFVYFKQ